MPEHIIYPIKGIDTDSDESKLQERAYFIKNMRMNWGNNGRFSPDKVLQQGSNAGVWTPIEANIKACGQTLPMGTNRTIGSHYSPVTNSLYSFIWNSEGQHVLQRIKKCGKCEQVILPCLNLQIDCPIYDWNATVFTRTGGGKQEEDQTERLVFTDGNSEIRSIDFDVALATNGFTTPFFDATPPCYDPCEYIELYRRAPYRCPAAELVERSESRLASCGLYQFRTRYNYFDGSSSTWSNWSSLLIPDSNCVVLPDRCIGLTIDVGSPIVKSVDLAYRICDRSDLAGEDVSGSWLLYDTIEKYEPCDDRPWYEWDLIENIRTETGDISYLFCGEKKCQVIANEDTDRSYSDLPRKSLNLARVEDSIVLANNLIGYDNLPCLPESVRPILNSCPIAICEPECRKVRVGAVIWDFSIQGSGPSQSAVWEYDEFCGWGGGRLQGNFIDHVVQFQENELSTSKDCGFLGWLEGSNCFGYSKQYVYRNGELTPMAPLNIKDGFNMDEFIESVDGTIVQVWEFCVPPGKYQFKIANHRLCDTDDYKDSSAYVVGNFDINTFDPDNNFPPQTSPCDSISIDVCDDDFDFGQVLWIKDPVTSGDFVVTDGRFYVSKDCRKPYTVNNGSGHYFVSGNDDTQVVNETITSLVYHFGDDCNPVVSPVIVQQGISTVMLNNDIYLEDYGIEINDCHFWEINGRVQDCDGNPISGVTIFTDCGLRAISKIDGSFKICVFPSFSITQQQTVQANWPNEITLYRSVHTENGCLLIDCDSDCDTCNEPITVIIPNECPCDGNQVLDDVVFTAQVANSETQTSLQSGGRYELGFKMHDAQMRSSFVQKIGDIEIPEYTDFCQRMFHKIGAMGLSDIEFPDWAKYVSFYISDNKRHSRQWEWIVDASNWANQSGSTLELNLPGIADPDSPVFYEWVEGDSIAFLRSDTQECFEQGPVEYFPILSQGGSTITIDNSSSIPDIECFNDDGYIVVKIVRAFDCEEESIYHEICSSHLVNDLPDELVLDYFDSFIYRRFFDNSSSCRAQNGVLVESTSLNDSCGVNCSSKGRRNIENKYAEARWLGSHHIKSGAFLGNSNISSLHDFRGEDSADYSEHGFGPTVSLHAERGMIFGITTNDWYVIGQGEELVRTGQGQLITSGEQFFGSIYRKVGQAYGVQMKDRGSIQYFDGLVFALDSNRAKVWRSNYSQAVSISENFVDAYFNEKIKCIATERCNGVDNRWISGIDPEQGEYLLTSYKVEEGFINRECNYKIETNETMAFSVGLNSLIQHYSFTPEWYSRFDGAASGEQLVSYAAGQAYYHHHRDVDCRFNEFYGETVDSVMIVSSNLNNRKNKRFKRIRLEMQEAPPFSVKCVWTNLCQESEVPECNFVYIKGMFHAAFLRSKTSQEGSLRNGRPLCGKWLKVMLTRPGGSYFELDGIVIDYIEI